VYELKGFTEGIAVEHCSASAVEFDDKIRVYTALHCVLDQQLAPFAEMLLVRPDASPQTLRLAISGPGATARILHSQRSTTALASARTKRTTKRDYFKKAVDGFDEWADDGCALEIQKQDWPTATWNRVAVTPGCPDHSTKPNDSAWGVFGGCNSATDCNSASVYQIYHMPLAISDSKTPSPWIAGDIVDNSQIVGGDSGGPLIVHDVGFDRLCGVQVAPRGKRVYFYKVTF
jgi:hypothetical protein